MIKAIIFDLGGTLIEYAGEFATWPELEEPGLNAAYSVLKENGSKLTSMARFRNAAFAILPERWQQATAGIRNLTVAGLLADVLDNLGLEMPAESVLATAADHYERAFCVGAAAIPHGKETLADLSAAGYRLGLISNTMFSSQVHVADLKRFDLAHFFTSMLFSADVNKWKPNRAPFHHVMSEMGMKPEVTVFVGDDPGADVAGARRAGMHVIHFESSDRFVAAPGITPDATIDDLRQISSVVQYMNNTKSGAGQ